MTVIAGARITGEARAEMAQWVARRYLAGEAIRPIAADLGRSYGFVQQLLVEAEVPLRRRGGDTRSPAARSRFEQTAARVAEVLADQGAPAGGKKSKAKKKAKAKAANGKRTRLDESTSSASKKTKAKNEKAGKKAKPDKDKSAKAAPKKAADKQKKDKGKKNR
ncbi:helix-turn-helix domain-containing protein [Propionibacteriaceae bacterium Y1923]|uniref:helix-turn-helix domain-containing protein n=1 Tax=Aestuariimicrobium sp. Y1814 TaxID=3418742 RepID=UPI003C19DE19